MTNFCVSILFLLLKVVLSAESISQDVSFIGEFTNHSVEVEHKAVAIPENCTRALAHFTEKVTNLTRCTVNNARPIRVCGNCEQEIKDTQESYNKMRSGPSICQQFYFESDQIGIINLVYSQGELVWTKNNCQNCYDHINETVQFFNVSGLLDTCIQNNNQSINGLNGTCSICEKLFTELNDIYNGFVKRIDSFGVVGVCMDIVDQMNITRRAWNRQDCMSFNSNIGYSNVITAVMVGTMPVFFYMLSKNISIIEDVKLVRPKRKSFVAMTSK